MAMVNDPFLGKIASDKALVYLLNESYWLISLGLKQLFSTTQGTGNRLPETDCKRAFQKGF